MRRSYLLTLCVFVASLASAQSVKSQDAVEAPAIEVKLVNPGDEPRRLVRFEPQAGDKQTAEMIMDLQQQMTLGGAAMPSQKIPPQKMTMEIEVTDVASNGDISFKFVYTDMKVIDDPNNPSPIAAAMEKMLAPMIGASGRGVVSNQGLTKSGKLDIPEGLSPQLKQMLEGMKDAINRLSSPVPAEAIGQGAEWKVVQHVVANGMKLKQTSTHTITAIDDNGFDMSVAITQQADPQEIKTPMLPAGSTMKLDALKSSGSGNTTIMEKSIFPVRSKVEVSTNADMSFQVGGQTQQMKMEMKMGMNLKQLGE